MEGTSFGKYRLIEIMGRGGMGEVWRAYDTATERVVALKILPSDISNNEVFEQRFRREAYATARLNNPHLIPIHTYGEIEGRLYVDMRLIEGADLQAVLSQGPLEPARAVHIVEQVAKGLHAAHKDGLLHRDVKPSNILLDADDFAYLIDFGIARAAGELALTRAGDVIGTYHYMAPERFGTKDVDGRSDTYSLACVLYECLTAQHPFPGETLQQQIGSHLRTPPPRPTSTNPGLPAGLDSVIAKGMAKRPEERYDTPVEMARAAQTALTTQFQLAPQRPPPRPQTTGGYRVDSGAQPAIRMDSGAHPTQSGPQPAIRMDSGAHPTHSGAHATQRMDSGAHPQVIRRQPTTPPPQSVSGPPTMARPVPSAVPRQEAARPGTTPPSTSKPSTSKPAPVPWWKRKPVLITAAALLAVVVAVAAMSVMSEPAPKADEYEQVTLPFPDLHNPQGLSVDSGGTVYVADTPNNHILALFANSDRSTVLAFDGLNYPTGVTADNTGTVYVNDAGNRRVLVLRAGSPKQEELHFTGLGNPTGLSVDGSFTVYVTDTANNRVLSLARGSDAQNVVPFEGQYALNAPTGLVVNSSGVVYVSDGGNNRVLKMTLDKKVEVLPFTGLKKPGGVTLDSQGAVYVTDTGNSRTLKLPAGSTKQEELHFTGLSNPWGLAVDALGTVYVGGTNNKIVALRRK